MDSPIVYLPMDRRQALARGETLPDRVQGAALFADISGFTPLTETLARELGPQRGSEEITLHLNLVYDALIAELHRFGGSVIGFSGDAITCWFDEDRGQRAVACGLAMEQAMARFATIIVPSGKTMSLTMKVAVTVGPARRFHVGDPGYWIVEVLAGATLDRLAATENHARGGEVVVDSATAAALGDALEIVAWREDPQNNQRFAVVGGLTQQVTPTPWPLLPDDALDEEVTRPWLLPAVYERLRQGLGGFLAELRPAVALFMAFTGIDYDLDDDAGSKLDTFIHAVQTILAPYDGTLIQLTMGDKGSYLYAAFGAPFAHEDDAKRAGSAALELRDLATKLDFLRGIRIGITQGSMRTGAYGGTMHRTYGVLGDATNLAARLMQAATPDQIVVTQRVQEMLAEDFTWERLPELHVKGRSEPITAYNLLAVKIRPALTLLQSQHELPLVGRQAEMTLVGEKMERVAQGAGQIIGITAEAGMGKSRLVAELMRLVDERQWPHYGGECSSYGTNTSYHVWYSIWWHFFGLNPASTLEEQIGTLETQLRWIDPGLLPRLPLLGTALNLPIPDNELTATFDAKLRKSSLEALLLDCLRARSQQTPFVLLLEDCHWLDPLSHDLLEAVALAVASLPVLMLLAYRPPQLQYLKSPRVSSLAHFAMVELDDFTPDEARRLIDLKIQHEYGSQAEISGDLAGRITQRAGGNPFFIEELLNYLRTQGIDPTDRNALAQLELPNSLQSLVLSRVDQLAENQKITLKVASVVGRLFEADTLGGYYPQLGGAERVREDLGALTNADLTLLEVPEPELIYGFRHGITQEVAYESLPFATRAMLHESLANYTERTAGPRLDQVIDQLAFHYGRSDNVDKKREYFLRAGERAQAAYNNATAIDYYRQALPLVEGRECIAVRLKLAQVMDLVGKWQEANELYQQALDLAVQLDDLQAMARCETAMGEHLRKRGLYKEAASRLNEARAKFEQIDDLAGVGQTLHTEGTLTAQQGDFERARSLYESSLEIRRQLNDWAAIASLLSNLGNVARLQGKYEEARALQEEGLAIRQESGDKWAIAVSLNNLGNVALNIGDHTAAREYLQKAVALEREVGDRAKQVNALNDLGNVVRSQGDYSAAQSLYTEALQINRELDNKWASAYLFEDVGCLAALKGQAERALQLVAAASALRQSIGAPLSPAEQSKLDELLIPAKEQLGEEGLAEANEKGRSLSLQQAIDLAVG